MQEMKMAHLYHRVYAIQDDGEAKKKEDTGGTH